MTWFYTQMVQWHVLLAWCSVALFFARGLAFQFGTARLQAIATDARLLVLVFGVNACLLMTGLSLWGLIGYHPIRDEWLGIKLLALVGYEVLYLNGSPTFGANFSDYFGVLVWGMGADVAARTITALGRVPAR